METTRILVVEDDPIVRRLAVKRLQKEGYEVLEAEDGKTALTLAFTRSPDLLLLDRMLPDMDGLEVLRRLRAHFYTCHIPVVLVTSRADVDDRVEGLTLGADDYVTKPFDRRELLARAAAALRRSRQNLAADPLSKLPGNFVLREHLGRLLEAGVETSIAYIDLDNFKAYVDVYGFEAAARVIQKAAQTLYNATVDHGDPDDFIGHIGGDDFLLISTPSNVMEVSGAIIRIFDEHAPAFYSDQDRERGYIQAVDRYGAIRRFPLVSLSIAVVDIPGDLSADASRLAQFAAECKKDVKTNRGRGYRRFRYEEPA